MRRQAEVPFVYSSQPGLARENPINLNSIQTTSPRFTISSDFSIFNFRKWGKMRTESTPVVLASIHKYKLLKQTRPIETTLISANYVRFFIIYAVRGRHEKSI